MMEWRYERKYRLEHIDHRVMMAELRVHPAGFTMQHPDRQVNNVYFDSPGLITFRENLSGISDREKFRLRWYGRELRADSPLRWEIKHKRNTLGTKSIQTITESLSVDDLQAMQRSINKQFRYGTDLVPALVNAYLRSYYISADGRYRVTIDRALQYFPVSGSKRFTRFNLFDPSVILELKYDREHDDHVGEIVDYFPYRQTKSSKYVTGMLMSQ